MNSEYLFEAIQNADLEGVKGFIEENGLDFYNEEGLSAVQACLFVGRFLGSSITKYQEERIPILKYLIEQGGRVLDIPNILGLHDTTLADDSDFYSYDSEYNETVEYGVNSIIYQLLLKNLPPIYVVPLLNNLDEDLKSRIAPPLRDYQVIQEVFGETKEERLSSITPQSIQKQPFLHPSLNDDVNKLIYSYIFKEPHIFPK